MKPALLNRSLRVIGSGPIADAPVASENNGLFFFDNTTGKTYQSGRKTCKFIDQSSIPHYFCDSVDGDDLNDGLSELTPKKTVSAIKALAVGSCAMNFKRGSYFREELSGMPENCVVKAYGTGDRPIFDCADVVTTFTKTGGYTNVYQKTYSHNLFSNTKNKVSMWFDHIRMIRVTTMELCDSTPASYYVVAPSGGSSTIYFHALDSVDPNADGRLYEVTVRPYGVQMSEGSECYSIHTQRNGHNDGSLIGTKYISDCYAYDGTVHNIWNGGIAEDCVADRCEAYSSGASTYFVSYVGAATEHTNFRYTRCSAVGIDAESYGWKINPSAGFYFHTSNNDTKINSVLIEDCITKNTGTFSGGHSKKLCIFNSVCIGSSGVVISSTDSYLLGFKCFDSLSGESSPFLSGKRAVQFLSSCESAVINGCGFGYSKPSGGFIYGISNNTKVKIEKTTFVTSGTMTVQFINPIGDASLEIEVNHCIFDNTKVGINKAYSFYHTQTSGLSLSGKKTLFGDTCGSRINNVSFSTLSELQALTSSFLDCEHLSGAVGGTSIFAGNPLNGEFNIMESSPAIPLEAGSTFWNLDSDSFTSQANVLNPL